MINVKTFFGSKKITLMGLGLLGRGVGDAEFLANTGANLIATDLKTETELAPSLERLKKFKNIVYHLGGHRLEDFENRDMILRAPNAPLDSPYLAHARAKGIPIEMDASLFAKLADATIVGITGTRGKSTVTHYIYEMLCAAGRTAWLGGNVRDTATLPLLTKAKKGDVAVLELDSWQLQGFEESQISPHVAIWTNFYRDHMNYYKGDMERYFRDKAAIVRFQKPGDIFITTPEIKERIETSFGAPLSICMTDISFSGDWHVALPGEHNRRNAAFAIAAARVLGVSDQIIKKVVATFTGLAGRLEFLSEKHGIEFWNDSNSTTPEATIAALKALAPKKKKMILIAGGNDKELDYTNLVPEIVKTTACAVLLKGAATSKLMPLIPKDFPVREAGSMGEAVRIALEFTKPGDIVLLSPAATSFGIFKNEYDRSDQFRKIVEALE